jgi:exonuclease III
MTEITIYLSVLTLKVNGLNSTIKRHSLMNWIKKEDTMICCLQETHLTNRNKRRLRMKSWKKIYQANGPPKIGRSSNIYLWQSRLQNSIDLMRKRRTFHTNKRRNIPKGNNNYQLICTQCQCTQFHQYTLRDLKAYINSNTVVVGEFNTPLSSKDRSYKQKSVKKS